MFCRSCGRKMADGLRFCDGCGADANPAPTATGEALASQVKTEMKSLSVDVWRGIKEFGKSPVGGLSQSYALFDDRRAIQIGIGFAIIYEASQLIAAQLLKSRVPLIGNVFDFGELSAGLLLRMLAIGFAPFISLVGGIALARLVFRGTGRFAGDVYTAGAMLLPFAVFNLAVGLLGVGNIEVVVLIGIFALTYAILILYAGCSRIAGIQEAWAAPAVPIILMASAWIMKILVVAFIGDSLVPNWLD